MPDRSKQGSLSIHGQNERWLREQALAASHAAIITDSNEPGNPIVYANPAFERITGYSIEEAIGKNCRFLQGEDREQPALEELRAAIREGRDCQVTLRNYKKDGTLFWNELSISPVHDEEGNLSNFVGVLGDVTERKRVQEALQYQLDLTTTITDNAADSLFLWDTEGRVTFMNSAAEQTFGWRQEELLGEVLHDRMHHHYPDGRPYPISECPLVKVFESAQTLRDHEDVFFCKDGSPIDVSCSLAPIVVSGEITGAVLVVRDIIERKRAEKALQISETRFRTIIEQSPLSIQILSPDGRTLQVNRAWETLWGVTLKDVAGYNMLEDQQLAAKGIMPYIQRGFAGEPTSIPPIIYDPDETLPGLTSHEEPKRWVKAFIQPIKDEAGTVREVVLMHEDITERKQAEEELRESEERFRRTFEQAAVGIAHVGTDGHWLRVNRRLCDIVGYEKEELLGLTFQDITHPDDLETDLEGARQLLAGEIETYSSEKRYFRKDGSTVWIYLTVSLVRSPSDEPRYFISVTEDITERKWAEEARARLAAIIESSEDAIIGKTLDGVITSWNRGAQKIYGYSAEEVVGKPVNILVPPERPDEIPKILDRMRRGEAIEHYETGRMTKDGRHLDISLTVSPIKDAIGNIVGASTIARDITERKRIEKALREQTETLEKVNRIGRLLSSELDLQNLVQAVTDEATELTGARFGAFFYNAVDDRGESYTLYTISGAPREAFSKFPMPRKTEIFGPTFKGEGVVRAADVREDPRYGNNSPYNGMPEGHLPVVSYLAVPVVSRSGEVLGGLFFGHPEAGVFGEREEQIAVGLAAQAAIAVDNARLFESMRESED